MDSILKPPMDLDGFGSNIKHFYPPVLNHTTTEGNFCNNNNTFTGKFPLFIGQCQIQPSNLISSYPTCGGPLNCSILGSLEVFLPFRKKRRPARDLHDPKKANRGCCRLRPWCFREGCGRKAPHGMGRQKSQAI